MVASPPQIERGGPPRAGRPPKGSPDTRLQLIDAAIACLGDLGARGATGREFCRRAGVSHGLLAYYFASFDDLLLAAYQDLCDRFLADFAERLAAADAEPVDRLESVFAMQLSEPWAGPAFFSTWTAFWSLTRSHAAFARINAAHNAALRRLLADALRGAAPGRALEPNAETGALILSGLVDGLWLELCLRPEDGKRVEAIALCRITLLNVLGLPRPRSSTIAGAQDG